jgi:hypothetical protein
VKAWLRKSLLLLFSGAGTVTEPQTGGAWDPRDMHYRTPRRVTAYGGERFAGHTLIRTRARREQVAAGLLRSRLRGATSLFSRRVLDQRGRISASRARSVTAGSAAVRRGAVVARAQAEAGGQLAAAQVKGSAAWQVRTPSRDADLLLALTAAIVD